MEAFALNLILKRQGWEMAETSSFQLHRWLFRTLPEKLLGLNPLSLTGNSGDVTINTGRLSVTNGARVSVTNDGSGNAGRLRIKADSIVLDNQGGITASTVSGEGGNIELRVGDILLLRHNSLISSQAGGTGNGGNIDIDADWIVAVPDKNSNIIANLLKERGVISTSKLKHCSDLSAEIHLLL
ncbi:MAG: hypothetical protein ACRDEA_01710 [Microcystaceae cyanobacterium]